MRALLLLIACSLLGACATAPAPGVDEHYMARVELGAQLGGAQIVWVNPPKLQEPAQPVPAVEMN